MRVEGRGRELTLPSLRRVRPSARLAFFSRAFSGERLSWKLELTCLQANELLSKLSPQASLQLPTLYRSSAAPAPCSLQISCSRVTPRQSIRQSISRDLLILQSRGRVQIDASSRPSGKSHALSVACS